MNFTKINLMQKIVLAILLFVSFIQLQAQTGMPFDELIYGRKDGTGLTMLQLKPTSKSNGKAIILVVAGAWNSSYYQAKAAVDEMKDLYSDKGFTVFEVIVGSQVRFAIDEQI